MSSTIKKQSSHLDIITGLNNNLKEVTLDDIRENPGQGFMVCMRYNSITSAKINLPENIIHISGEHVFVETETLTKQQLRILLDESLSYQIAMENQNMLEAIKEAILNGKNKKTALVKVVREHTGDQKETIYDVLDILEGKLWKVASGPHNSKIYSLL
jgi:hypothetical protein